MEKPKLLFNTPITSPPIRSVSHSVPERLESITTIDAAGDNSYVAKIRDAVCTTSAKKVYSAIILTAATAGCVVGMLFYNNVLKMPNSHYLSYSNDTTIFLNNTDLNTTDSIIEMLGTTA